jgi:nicotinate-nucleotide pyrophosphorylase (carboxylating)
MSVPGPPLHAVRQAVALALAEDLGHVGDVTTSAVVDPSDHAAGAFVARADGVLAGTGCAVETFRQLGDAVQVDWTVSDGATVLPGDVLGRVDGPLGDVLTGERTALNFLCHLSGVATTTARWVAAVEGTGAARVRDTRKTTPGMRLLEKYAVRCGGGTNHRTSLSDQALVKDNHVLAAGGVVPAYRAVRRRYPDLPVQVEVTTLDQLRELLEAGADQVLLDNMDVATMTEAVRINAGRAALEASGGLSLGRAREVAATGVDYLAVGALTHSAPVLDIAMDLVG